MQFDVLTIFPGMFEGFLTESMIGRAVQRSLFSVNVHNIRDYAIDKHHMTDDTPYGGGGGMVMKPEPIFAAAEAVRLPDAVRPARVVLLTPQGRLFGHALARELSQETQVMLICGRYEGIDERVREHLATDEVSIGDYVITGGELAAAVIIDAVGRMIPGALGDPAATYKDSHADGLLEYPQYTRPAEFRGWRVPEILVSGDHPKVDRWRREQALLRTLRWRPELLAKVDLGAEDRRFLASLEESATEGE